MKMVNNNNNNEYTDSKFQLKMEIKLSDVMNGSYPMNGMIPR